MEAALPNKISLGSGLASSRFHPQQNLSTCDFYHHLFIHTQVPHLRHTSKWAARMTRKLKYHEQKLLKKWVTVTDTQEWRSFSKG